MRGKPLQACAGAPLAGRTRDRARGERVQARAVGDDGKVAAGSILLQHLQRHQARADDRVVEECGGQLRAQCAMPVKPPWQPKCI